MPIDTCLAAIVGVGQGIQRPAEVARDGALGPIELMLAATATAAQDAHPSAGTGALLSKIGFIGVAGGWFRYRNPGQLIAERIGAPNAATAITAVSGTGPQDLLGYAAEQIAAGKLEAALIVGGEARWTHQRLKRAGEEPTWITDPGLGDPELFSTFDEAMIEETIALGAAAVAYSLFEDSLRASHGRSVDAHRTELSELWARFSSVAADNMYAWDRAPHDTASIRNADPSNRMISFPYTKAMVANNTVNMSSAVILCSVGLAKQLGISSDQMVFPHVVTRSHETWRIVERNQLHDCPALTAAGKAAFEHAGISAQDISHIDLYACFPAIVQMSSAALGLDTASTLTVTGGLGFAGAAIGNAVGHSIAAMTAKVRTGGLGLVHGNGGQATKHSFAVYSTKPPKSFLNLDVQDQVDHQARVPFDEAFAGPVSIEAATVVYGRDGQDHALCAVLDNTGQRGWARSKDPAVMQLVETEGLASRTGTRTADGQLHLA